MNQIYFDIGVLVLRIGLGAMMIVHGLAKLKIIISSGAQNWLDPIGIGPSASLYLATFAELACSALVMAGLFTRSASVILAFTMFVAGFVFLREAPWQNRELAVLFFVGFVGLAFLGGGRYSLSALLFGSGKLANF